VASENVPNAKRWLKASCEGRRVVTAGGGRSRHPMYFMPPKLYWMSTRLLTLGTGIVTSRGYSNRLTEAVPKHQRGVAQPGSALGLGPRGRQFEPDLPDFMPPKLYWMSTSLLSSGTRIVTWRGY
jgi:hypothetical protein